MTAPLPQAPAGAVPAPVRGSGKAVAALVLGIVGLALGFLGVTLICSVLAIIMASLAMQDMSAAPREVGGHGRAVAGLVLGITALAVWGAVLAAALIARSA
jgi:Domain of unknown function (DUF4190)